MLSLSLRGIICQKLIKKRKGGRCAAFEIMVINSAIQNLIRTDSIHNIQSNLETGSRYGMMTMQQYTKQLLDNNIIEQFDAI
jgi:twitching motility protein PilT